MSWPVCYFKGRSLRCSLGRGCAGLYAVMLYVGEGPRGSIDACSTLLQTSIFHSTTHYQTGPLCCWFPSGWACARPRPLWVSPVRLGVSPAAAPTPMGFFNQRFAWVAWSASLPAVCPVYLWSNVGPQGLLVVRLPAPFVPHSTSLGPARTT